MFQSPVLQLSAVGTRKPKDSDLQSSSSSASDSITTCKTDKQELNTQKQLLFTKCMSSMLYYELFKTTLIVTLDLKTSHK